MESFSLAEHKGPLNKICLEELLINEKLVCFISLHTVKAVSHFSRQNLNSKGKEAQTTHDPPAQSVGSGPFSSKAPPPAEE